MKILIIQSKGNLEMFNESLCLQRAFERLGENPIVWGDGFESFNTKLTDICVDVELVVVMENDSFEYIVDLDKVNCKKVLWSRNGHIVTQLEKQTKFVTDNGIQTVLNASHVSIEHFKSDTVKSVWFPLCVDTELYPQVYPKKQYPLVFCGDSRTNSEILTFIDLEFGITPFPPPESKGDFYNKVTTGWINFIISPEEIIPSEVFETIASGSIVCMNKVNGIDSLFSPEQEILIHTNATELFRNLSTYLSNQKVTNEMITNSRTRLLNCHTYNHRANQLLHIINK